MGMMDPTPCFSAQRPDSSQQFTGKERDAETGLDFFEARYYSGPQARFLSVDPENAGASSEDPQSWNAYAYGRNNPLKYTDPDGLAYQLCTPGGGCIYDYSDADFYFNFQMDPTITLSSGTIWANGSIIGYYSQLSEDSWFKRYQDTLNVLPDYLERRSQYQFSQGNYLAGAIDKAGKFLAPSNNFDVGLMFVGGSLGKVSGKVLSKPVQKLLRGIEHLADKTVRDAILSQGGVGSTVRKVGHYADKTVLEAAEDLARDKGNRQARQALKLVDQAAKKAQTYGSSK
jgi:RHS repeat-associated protein